MVTVRKFGAGQSVRRTEDRRLVTGHGHYTDDINLAHQAHGYVLRSPHAHARVRKLDKSKAERAPGVLLVLIGADAKADKVGDLPCVAPVPNKDGSECYMPPYPVLAQERVRYVGECVAFVVAETQAEAREAAELITVDYEALPAVADTAAAAKAGAPLVWDKAKNNLCADFAIGDKAAVDKAFASAARVAKVDLVNNRVVVASMEPRGALADYNAGEDKFTLHTSTQGVHMVRDILAGVFGVSTNQVQVITKYVGGGFGMKAVPFPEQALVLWAARRLRRPVKWTSDRTEAFVSDTHGRDHVSHAELALDKNGKFLAIRVATAANMGAYLSAFAPVIPTLPAARMHAAVYGIPLVYVEVKAVFTNTTPVEAYRGAGRPEAAYLVERLVDVAARETGIDPAELRRRNYLPPNVFPYTTSTELTYDSGAYEKNMDDAMKAADWTGFATRRAEAAKRGKLRGIGMSYYIEICGTGGSELAEIRFDSSDAVTLMVGTQSTGQGHETAFAQVLADKLGVPFENIRVLQGDTDIVSYGGGTGGSRSLQICGPAIQTAADKVIAKSKRIAAHMLEAAEADLTFSDGKFTIAGTDRSITFEDVRKRAFQAGRLPKDIEPGLNEKASFVEQARTFPNGCHIAEVEVDPDTGTITLAKYVIVDDFGKVMNPLLVEGQVHGGLGQGIGQALLEGCAYDSSGQLLTGSFMDYTLPRAGDLPSFNFRYNEVPSPSNPMGVKGCGEAGCVAAPAAVVNATVDALAKHGIRHLDMPLTPERVWRALNRSRAAE